MQFLLSKLGTPALATAVALLAMGAARSQLPGGHGVIATALPATPATQLLVVDLATGTVTPLSRFTHDDLPPLALRVDFVNRDVLLAVDLGGATRILRLGISGAVVTRVRVLADVPGSTTDIVVTYPGDLTASVGGPQGGLLHVPRNGGAGTPSLTAPRIAGTSTLSNYNSEVWIAESGTGGTPAQLRMFDTRTGLTAGPYPQPAIQPPTLTGIADLLTSIPTHVLSTTNGEVWRSIPQQSVIRLPITPALPAGGTRAVRVAMDDTGFVLGGAVDPFLRSFDAYNTAPQTWNVIAGPLPGDPVAFDISQPPGPLIVQFGERCSPSSTAPALYTQGGYPKLGNANFGLTTTGIPQIPVILALGLSDQQYFGLSLPLELQGGGCELLVSPDVALVMTTNQMGMVSRQIPIPSTPVLNGIIVFAQWIHLNGGPLIAATDAMALHVYP